MARDYYEDAEAIARMLDAEGAASVASEFREAITAGSTATEILMRLRYQCQQALDASVGGELTRARISDLADALHEALG